MNGGSCNARHCDKKCRYVLFYSVPLWKKLLRFVSWCRCENVVRPLCLWPFIGPVTIFVYGGTRWKGVQLCLCLCLTAWESECGTDGSILSGAMHQIMACDQHESCNHSRAPLNATILQWYRQRMQINCWLFFFFLLYVFFFCCCCFAFGHSTCLRVKPFYTRMHVFAPL